jgi:acetyltransferase-like isoleucine patch superfamily enzyme
VRIGEAPSIGGHSVIYSNVSIGNHFACGNGVLIREDTVIGDYVTIRDHCSIGAGVSIANKTLIEPHVHIPRSATIGSGVVVGPNVQFLSDLSSTAKKQDILLEDGCIISEDVILHPGVCVGEGAQVNEGTVITGHVPPHTCVFGNPMKFRPLDDQKKPAAEGITAVYGKKEVLSRQSMGGSQMRASGG